VLGPLALEEFLDFLPTGWAFAPLCDLVRFYVGDELGFSVRLRLKAREMPGARLSAKGGARLGWTSWLKGADWPEDDLRLSEVGGPFCHLRAVESSEDDSQVVVSPASLRAFAVAVPAATRSPYFALPPDKLAELEERMTRHSVKANRTVVRQGAPGCSMFIIRSGAVRISRREPDGSDTHLATLREGDYFGEMALITGQARNATAVTLRACELLELSKEALDDFIKRYPRFGASLRAFAEERT
jgi:Cyclic nucleotide-binding domain/Type VI secretion, TssG